ncbi:hypothetical protein CAI21_01925 [Alkalilimnicola ehrlichii]|uniref:Secretin/TonB short N-terminal domain-containing protein n=1 Tax=Alkalilimnicola ehrlichii TaxID=351052 RepID=A0A3E0X3C1_9GAMM|nr:TonB-dependent receptor [Alkalilimnicola ehrlichii]RFA31396.1 hypothetical protein CAI21_01925 [Alkalilimnicola ehrlichii]RFA39332.1 hypothetical protein CAL65_00475 [Alkalilimnicola ehrlichii]
MGCNKLIRRTVGWCVLLAGGLLALTLHAAESAHRFDIPPGGLDQTLTQFALQAGLVLYLDPALAQGQTSPGLQGEYRPRHGLSLLLSGTGLTYREDADSGAIAIVPRAAIAASERQSLPALLIEARPWSPGDDAYTGSGSANVLTQRDIELFRGSSVGDIFQGTPGVLVGENRNSGGLDLNIRGMQGQGRVPVLIDGSRQETTVHRGYAGVASRSYVDPDLIGGIRIDKGPSMTAEGSGAVGGLVSMRTLEPNDIIKDGKDFGVRLRGTAIGNNSGRTPSPGTPAGYNTGNPFAGAAVYRTDCIVASLCQGEYALPERFAPEAGMDRPGLLEPKSHAASVAVAGRLAWADLLAAYAERRQGNYYAGRHGRTPSIDLSDVRELPFYTEVRPVLRGASRFRGGERIVNSNYESQSVLLKGQLWLPREQNLELSYLNYRSTYGELMPSQLMWFDQVRQTASSEVTANTYTARYRWDPFASDYFDLRANLWHTDTRSSNDPYFVPGADGEPMEMGGTGSEHYRRWGADLSNSMRFEGFGRLEARYGGSAQLEKLRPRGEIAEDTPSDNRDGDRHELSAFAALEYQPLPSVTLEAGIRHTRFRSKDNTPMAIDPGNEYCPEPDGDGGCLPFTYRSRNHGTVPMAGLTWEPVAGIRLYARYAEALRMPSLFETTQGFSVAPTPGLDLKPEHAYHREVGINMLRHGLLGESDRLGLRIAYFRNRVKDYITRTPRNLWEEETDNFQQNMFRIRNIESASFHGYEVSAEYDAGWLFGEFGGTWYSNIETCHEGSYRRQSCTDYGVPRSYINNMIPPTGIAAPPSAHGYSSSSWSLALAAPSWGSAPRFLPLTARNSRALPRRCPGTAIACTTCSPATGPTTPSASISTSTTSRTVTTSTRSA